MKKELAKSYQPKDFEDRIYAEWMEKGCFHAEVDSKKQPYTIVIPPPNITGQLHMGHALDETLQDILIRWRPCLHCNRSKNCRSHAERGHQERRPRTGWIPEACMGLEKAVRRQNRRTAEKIRLFL